MTFRALPALLTVLVVVVALALSPTSAARARAASTVAAPSAAAAITSTALASVGTHEGQCFPFVQRVVRSATGRSIGGDYRQGYLDAGGVEVPLLSAQAGDIIQLIDDQDTSASADYPGMHTAIVLENLGSGKFTVVDSNANFDGMVQIREYEPRVVAARFSNISVHVYRVTEGAAPAASAGGTVTGSSVVPLAPGVTALIAADGDCLRIRSVPSLRGEVLGCLPTGGTLTVADGTAEADGYRWRQVTGAGMTGWAAEQYLRGSTPPSARPAEPPAPPSTTGKIVGGGIPEEGFGLLVYGGGSGEQLVAASGCPKETSAFWASADGEFVTYIPAATVAVVNAPWLALFPDGIPAGTALMGRCA